MTTLGTIAKGTSHTPVGLLAGKFSRKGCGQDKMMDISRSRTFQIFPENLSLEEGDAFVWINCHDNI